MFATCRQSAASEGMCIALAKTANSVCKGSKKLPNKGFPAAFFSVFCHNLGNESFSPHVYP
jgi:hypothetical protein